MFEKQRWLFKVLDACLSLKNYQLLNGLKRSRSLSKKRILASLTQILDNLEPYKEFQSCFFDTDDKNLLQYWDRVKFNKCLPADELDRVRNFIRDVLENYGTSRQAMDRLFEILCTDEEQGKIIAVSEQGYTKKNFPHYWWLSNTNLPYMFIYTMTLPSIGSHYLYGKAIGFRQSKSTMNYACPSESVYEAVIIKKLLVSFANMHLCVVDIKTDIVINSFKLAGVTQGVKFIGFCHKSDNLYLMASVRSTQNVQYIRISYIELVRKRGLREINPIETLEMEGFEVFNLGSHTLSECRANLSNGYLIVYISKWVYQLSWKIYVYKLTGRDGINLIKESSPDCKALVLKQRTEGHVSDQPTEAFKMAQGGELLITPDCLIIDGVSSLNGRKRGIVAFSLNEHSNINWVVYDEHDEKEFNSSIYKGEGSGVYGFSSKNVPCVLTINMKQCKTTVYSIVKERLCKVAEDIDNRAIKMLSKEFRHKFSRLGSLIYVSDTNKLLVWHSELKGADTARPRLFFKFKQFRIKC